MRSWRVSPIAGAPAPGPLKVPGDKSISHRAVMLAALADGESEIVNFLPGEDCLATARVLESLGVPINWLAPDRLLVRGGTGLRPPEGALDCGNAGTGMRLLTGLLAGQGVAAELHGDASLNRRPMRRIIEPLARMGARIDALGEDGRPPLRLAGNSPIHGISCDMPFASAQVKSAILLAGLGALGETCVSESIPTRDHTERMLPGFGVAIERSRGRACLAGQQQLRATRIDVPGDFSSAAFLLLAGLIGPREVRVDSVGVNSARTGFLRLAGAMGGCLQTAARKTVGAEPVADVIAAPGALRGARLPASLVPSAIDEMPAVFAAAACAAGETVIEGAAELRVKETDRIAAMVAGLKALGVHCGETADGARIRGGRVGGGEIDCRGDHRVAMAFSILALAAQGPIVVRDVDCVATSFPGFADTALQLGLNIEPIE